MLLMLLIMLIVTISEDDGELIEILMTWCRITTIQVSHIGIERERTDMKIEEEEELFKNLKSKVHSFVSSLF